MSLGSVDVAVRPATVADAPQLAALAAAGIEEQAAGRGGAIWSRREALVEPSGECLRLVGTIDGAVVAYATVGVDALSDGARLGVVTAIYVDPGAREVSVGEALLDAAIDWCRERRCVGIDAHALPGNRATKNFFETFGLTARLIVVHKDLT